MLSFISTCTLQVFFRCQIDELSILSVSPSMKNGCWAQICEQYHGTFTLGKSVSIKSMWKRDQQRYRTMVLGLANKSLDGNIISYEILKMWIFIRVLNLSLIKEQNKLTQKHLTSGLN